jgi:hypothetical protein
MAPHLIKLGYDNAIAAHQVVAIVNPRALPIRKFIQECRRQAKVIDATHGRKTRAVIITEAGFAVLSSVNLKTLAERFK